MKALGHPRRPIENSTTESTASKNYVHKKLYCACLYNIFKDKSSQGDQDPLGHRQRHQQAQPLQIQQIPVMFIKD